MTKQAKGRRRLAGPERRALILDAAGRLFGERGYERTRLEEVAGAAGVTKPVLYLHFDSKTALYLAILERHREDLGGFAGAIPAEGGLEERLRTVLDAWFGYVESHAYAWRMLFRDSGGGPQVEAFRAEVSARARAVLAGLIGELAERPVPRAEVEPLAELMSMGMAGLALWWIEGGTAPREAMVGAMTRSWVGVLTGGSR